jgi:hypothetical protein
MDLSEAIVLGLEAIGFMVLILSYVLFKYTIERLKSYSKL